MIMLAEGYAIHEATLRERFIDYGEAFRDRMALAVLITGGDYVQAVRRRRELIAEFATAMTDLDIMITAAAPSMALSNAPIRGRTRIIPAPTSIVNRISAPTAQSGRVRNDCRRICSMS